MDAFEKWVEDYALMHEREITKADCEAAFRAGMRRAAEIADNVRSEIDGFGGIDYNVQVMREHISTAILAEADK